MKQFTLLAALAVAVIGASAVAGAVRANEIADKAQQTVEANSEEKSAVAALTEISAEDLQVLIDTTPNLVIIDARRDDTFAQGHIPGAIALTPANATADRLTALAPLKDTPMVFYCGSVKCPASGKAAHKAAEYGYTKLYKYTAGITDWKEKGMPVVAE